MNQDFFSKQESDVLVERQQQAQHRVVDTLTRGEMRRYSSSTPEQTAEFELAVEQAVHSTIFVFECETELAARWGKS